MRRIGSLNIAFVLLLLSALGASAAKQDIRGVTLGMTRDQLKAVLTKGGARCNDIGFKTLCYFNDGSDQNGIEVDFDSSDKAFKLDYVFYFHTNPEQIKQSIINQYALKPINGTKYYSFGNNIGADIEFMGNKGRFFIMNLDDNAAGGQTAQPKF